MRSPSGFGLVEAFREEDAIINVLGPLTEDVGEEELGEGVVWLEPTGEQVELNWETLEVTDWGERRCRDFST